LFQISLHLSVALSVRKMLMLKWQGRSWCRKSIRKWAVIVPPML